MSVGTDEKLINGIALRRGKGRGTGQAGDPLLPRMFQNLEYLWHYVYYFRTKTRKHIMM